MDELPGFVESCIDLAQPRVGGDVLKASDDFFAPRHRLIKPAEPVFLPDQYDDHGKWMDGWESRRRRDGGHDWCIVKICPGTIYGLDIDTRYFTGNYPSGVSVEACCSERDPDRSTPWETLLPRSDLAGDQHNYFAIEDRQVWTHLRLNIYPDGGIARLRVYGEAHCDWALRDADEWVDLVAMINGGRALACNDQHYGHISNLIAPGKAANMGDGWETRRRREAGHDWVMLKLGHAGSVRKVELDTAFFKGNYPDRCMLLGAYLEDVPDADLDPDAHYWQGILPAMKLEADSLHVFLKEVMNTGPITHVQLRIYPDGGVSRLRLIGPVYRP